MAWRARTLSKALRRPQRLGLDREGPELVVEPGAPHRRDGIARLQHRPQPPRAAAAHDAEMAAVLGRQQFDDRAGLAIGPRAQHHAAIPPFHHALSSRLRGFSILRVVTRHTTVDGSDGAVSVFQRDPDEFAGSDPDGGLLAEPSFPDAVRRERHW